MLSPKQYWSYKQNEKTFAFVGLILLVSGFFDPMFRGVQGLVYSMAFTSHWGA